MNQNQENSREFLQQAIDARIKALEESFLESVRVLRHERNALAPVSSLPPEVFAAIFSFVCFRGEPSLGGNPGYNLARIRLSHVCHQWREIALNQPLLWSHVDFTTLSSAGAAEILARAKSVPLYLEASIFGERRNNVRFHTFKEELQARIPRTRHLCINAESTDICSILAELGSPAPTLEYLSLFSVSEYSRANVSIPDTLFDGAAPRLFCLKLHRCGISWEWPLLKGLRYLEILTPFTNSSPNLAVWLDALAEMSELKTLTLNHASPNAPLFPFDVARTVTLSALTHFYIVATLEDCAFALAHLDLPALTRLSLEANNYYFPKSSHVQELLPYVARHAYGTQDTQPLQSMLIRNNSKCVDLLAWSVPDIDVEAHESDPPTLLGAALAPRLALSFRFEDPLNSHPYPHLALLDWLVAGLPLDSIVMLAAQGLCSRSRSERERILPAKQFWFHISPKFSQLRRVRLSPSTADKFIEMLLEDNEGRDERPLLPSLTELIVVDASDYDLSSLRLCDALMKRVEQGVPLEVLDLRMCFPSHSPRGYITLLRQLSEIAVDVLGPESYEASEHKRYLWKHVPLGHFLNDGCREDSESYTGSDAEGEYEEEW